MNKQELLKEKEKKLNTILNEIRIHRQLSHTNICKFELCFEDERNIYIVLEYCQKNSLQNLLKNNNCEGITEYEIKQYMFGVLKAMLYLKSRHIVHRDLTLQNIFLDKENNVKLGDFGLSAKINESDESLSCDRGTPGYIPPDKERLNSANIEKLDVFAFGVCIYKLLCKNYDTNFFDDKLDIFTELFQQIRKKDSQVKFDNDIFCSKELFDLLIKKIFVETEERFSFEQIYASSFFQRGDFPRVNLKEMYVENDDLENKNKKMPKNTTALKELIIKQSKGTNIDNKNNQTNKTEPLTQKDKDLLKKCFVDKTMVDDPHFKLIKVFSINNLLKEYRESQPNTISDSESKSEGNS